MALGLYIEVHNVFWVGLYPGGILSGKNASERRDKTYLSEKRIKANIPLQLE